MENKRWTDEDNNYIKREFISLGTDLTYKLIDFIHELFTSPIGGRKLT